VGEMAGAGELERRAASWQRSSAKASLRKARLSFPRKRESRPSPRAPFSRVWIPACAGMTEVKRLERDRFNREWGPAASLLSHCRTKAIFSTPVSLSMTTAKGSPPPAVAQSAIIDRGTGVKRAPPCETMDEPRTFHASFVRVHSESLMLGSRDDSAIPTLIGDRGLFSGEC
jgi:hypothetical protein